jgi:hypothetical protein
MIERCRLRVCGLMDGRMQEFMAFTALHGTKALLRSASGSPEEPTFTLTLEHVDAGEIRRAMQWLKDQGCSLDEPSPHNS